MDVTVGDEGAVNDGTATILSDPLPPPTPEDDGCTSVAVRSTEGEGFASDTTWEERTWNVSVRLKENMFWARIGGIRALQGRWLWIGVL